jgi:hypothetical protein
MTQQVLSKEITDKIREEIESITSQVEWDYREEISNEDKIEILENGFHEFEQNLYEMNMEYITNLEWDCVANVIDQYRDEIKEEIGEEFDEEDISELIDDMRDYLPSVDLNLEGLLGTADVQISLLSNYDCINSHWFESSAGYEYKETYFGDMVDALYLNPAKVKKMLVEQDIKVWGRWPNLKYREGKEYVKYRDFLQEIINSCAPANLLTITGQIKLIDLVNGEPQQIIVPKGNYCGLFSDFSGGGSVMSMVLQRSMIINLKKSDFAIFADGQRGYSIKEVYGIDSQAFEGEIEILK